MLKNSYYQQCNLNRCLPTIAHTITHPRTTQTHTHTCIGGDKLREKMQGVRSPNFKNPNLRKLRCILFFFFSLGKSSFSLSLSTSPSMNGLVGFLFSLPKLLWDFCKGLGENLGNWAQPRA